MPCCFPWLVWGDPLTPDAETMGEYEALMIKLKDRYKYVCSKGKNIRGR